MDRKLAGVSVQTYLRLVMSRVLRICAGRQGGGQHTVIRKLDKTVKYSNIAKPLEKGRYIVV